MLGSNNRRNKRGQVTVFIILGILILFLSAGILYVSRIVVKEKIGTEEEPVIAVVPQVFQPLQTYTENCLTQIGMQGLRILGEQGGYIYPDLAGTYSPTQPTDSDGLNLEPLKVPYWHYNIDKNTVDRITFASLQPELFIEDDPELSIEGQLRRFAMEKLDGCLAGYTPFFEQGFSINQGAITDVGAIIGETGVSFLLTMDVDATLGEAKHRMEQFFVRIPLELKRYYETAAQISGAEKNYSFLERQGMELIAIYSRVDADLFPPTSDVGYEFFSVLSWSEVQLKNKFIALLTSNVPLLRFLGSSNFYYATFPEGNRLAQKVVDNMVLPLIGAEDLEISFDYFGWEPYFKMNSEAGVYKPEHLFVNFGPLSFGTQRYEAHYDSSYPVLVTIRDPAAFAGEGYEFVFAMESNIRNNEPAVGGVLETFPRKVTPASCDEEQRTTELIKTVVVDSFTKEPIELVKVGFSIPEQAECEIGLSNKAGVVESKYPAAYGGVINFVHPEYLKNFYPINTYKVKDEPQLLGYAVAGVEEPEKVIELDRLRWINVSVKKKEVKKCLTPLVCQWTTSGPLPPGLAEAAGIAGGLSILPYREISCEKGERQCFFNSKGSLFDPGEAVVEFEVDGSLSKYNAYHFLDKEVELKENEEVILNLERIGGFHEEVRGDQFFVTISVKGNESTAVQLVPGIYKVQGMASTAENIIIPLERRCFKYDIFFGIEKEDCFPVPNSTIEGFANGNMQCDTEDTYLVITPDDLYTSQHLTLFVLTQDILSLPQQVKTITRECAGWSCLPEVGCAGESCVDSTVTIAGRIIEDVQVGINLGNVSRKPEVRAALEPVFS